MQVAEEDLGEDFAGALDLDQNMGTVSGGRAVAECVARRWYDRPGSLFYDRNYGAGLETYLNAFSDVDNLARTLEDEALKDERVDECTVAVSLVSQSLQISARIVTADGPFAFGVSVSQLDVKVLLETAI